MQSRGSALTKRTGALTERRRSTRKICLIVGEMLKEPRREGGELVGLSRFEVQRWYRRSLVDVIEQRWCSRSLARFSFAILGY